MIHKIRTKKSDRKFLSDNKAQTAAEIAYRDTIVKKPWGYEYLLFENDFVAIWILQIVRRRKTSMHCHPSKKTGLVLLSGNATCYHLDGKITIGPLDTIMIEEGAFHCTEASSHLPITPQSEDGIWVMEIESPPKKTDLVRLKDEYGRQGTPYEGADSMIFKSKARLKFKAPNSEEVVSKTFLDCVLTVRKGPFEKGKNYPDQDAIICVIAADPSLKSKNPYLTAGEFFRFEDFCKNTENENLSGYTFLTIEKSPMLVKLSGYIFSFIAGLGVKNVFAVCGGGAMHLVDSLGSNKDLGYIATHHEQAAAMAAEGYARISGTPGVALVTSGPGGTNTITGVCGAWIDSIPVIFISGQVTTNTLIEDTGLRQFGIQEANIVDIVKPITKYAVTVKDARFIKYHLQKALHLATTGRPGPVWLDIPLDIQSKLINPDELISFVPEKVQKDKTRLKKETAQVIALLRKVKRPVLISGYGIRLAKAKDEFVKLVEKLKIPVVSSWTSSDLLASDHKFYIGRSGIMGDRAGNFTVQNADLLFIIGSRMSIPQVGYNYKVFAREAKKIMIDIEKKEMKKPSLKLDVSINADAKEFITEMIGQLDKKDVSLNTDDWLKRCHNWKNKYPVVLPEYKENKKEVNSFYFTDVLSEKLDKDAVVVTDMGTSFTCTMQTFKVKKGQRLFTSGGHAPMGFGLPGAIGACFANKKRKTICISGDGGLQMNIQELQTLVHYNLPIILFVLNNGGYLTIKLMQQNHFGRYVGSDKDSGLSCPDIIKVANSYGIKSERIANHDQLHSKIDKVLAQPGPFICEIIMSETQPLIPRVTSVKRPDGTIISRPLEDLYPFLDRKEFLENMIIKPLEVLKE